MQILEKHDCVPIKKEIIVTDREAAVNVELLLIIVTRGSVLRTCLGAGMDLDNTAVAACLLLLATTTYSSII